MTSAGWYAVSTTATVAGALVISVLRDGSGFVPKADTVVEAGDEVGSAGARGLADGGQGGERGAAAGELASAMAADLIHRHMATHWANDGTPSADRFAFRMKEAVELANEQIYAYAREHPEVRGMGTTVTAAGVYGNNLYLTQIGDSRAYLIRNGEAIQLTKDQSLMQRLVDAGELTEEEAEQSERRNIILQALGPDPRVKVDLTHQTLRRGDTLVATVMSNLGFFKAMEAMERALNLGMAQAFVMLGMRPRQARPAPWLST